MRHPSGNQPAAGGPNVNSLSGDLTGGTLAALMSVPAAMAYGVLVFGQLGEAQASVGVVAGLIGLAFGNLASAPWAGSRILSNSPGSLPTLLLAASIPPLMVLVDPAGTMGPAAALGGVVLVVALAGTVQIGLGLLNLGALARYVPYPVSAGLLAGTGVLILQSQVRPVLGVSQAEPILEATRWGSVAVALCTLGAMGLGPRILKKVPVPVLGKIPAPALGIALGTGVYYVIATTGGTATLGPTVGAIPNALPRPDAFVGMVSALMDRSIPEVLNVVGPLAVGLAAVCSLDSMVGTIAGDSVSGDRSDGNKELVAQGVSNIASAAFGGIASVGSASRTLVNYQYGGRTRRSRVVSGAFALAVLLVLSPVVAHVPIVVLAGLLVSAALGLFDRWPMQALQACIRGTEPNPRVTLLNVGILLSVATLTVVFGVLEAVGVGVLFSLVYFAKRMGTHIVRRQYGGDAVHSNSQRNVREFAALQAEGDRIQVLELEGSLFFGTADTVSSIVTELVQPRLVALVLDLRQIAEFDISAANLLFRAIRRAREAGVEVFVSVAKHSTAGQEAANFGLADVLAPGCLCSELNEALDAAENLMLRVVLGEGWRSVEIGLTELDAFADLDRDDNDVLARYAVRMELPSGTPLFRQGDAADGLYGVTAGQLRIEALVEPHSLRRISMLGPGTLVGEMAIIDGRPRSATATAQGPTVVYRITREQFESIKAERPVLATAMLAGIAREVSTRLRIANRSIR